MQRKNLKDGFTTGPCSAAAANAAAAWLLSGEKREKGEVVTPFWRESGIFHKDTVGG